MTNATRIDENEPGGLFFYCFLKIEGCDMDEVTFLHGCAGCELRVARREVMRLFYMYLGIRRWFSFEDVRYRYELRLLLLKMFEF